MLVAASLLFSGCTSSSIKTYMYAEFSNSSTCIFSSEYRVPTRNSVEFSSMSMFSLVSRATPKPCDHVMRTRNDDVSISCEWAVSKGGGGEGRHQ